MSIIPSIRSALVRRRSILAGLTLTALAAAQAADVYWLGDIDGNGVWDRSSANWAAGSVGGIDAIFTDGDLTFFHLSGGQLNLVENLSTVFQQIGSNRGRPGLDYVFTSDVAGGVKLDYTGSAPLEFFGIENQLTIGSGVTARMTTGNDSTLHVRGNGNTLNIDGGALLRRNGSILNLSAVTVNVTNGGVLGSDTGSGIQIFLGRGAAATLNVSTGGLVHVGDAAGGRSGRSLVIAVGAGGSGEVTLSGGEINIYNGGDSALKLGDHQKAATTATFNLDGGVLHTRQIKEQDRHGFVASTFNFNGGVLEASANNPASTNFMEGIDHALVQAGGAIIDTDGQSVTIDQSLERDAALGTTVDGGLTKQGEGTLTLGGANTYTGDTVILGGTDRANMSVLALTSANLADSGKVRIEEFGVLQLDFDGADTVAGLVLNGAAMAPGTWGSSESGADHVNDTYFRGEGQLLVTTP